MTRVLLIFAAAISARVTSGQSHAQLSGLIQDPSLLQVAGAEITVRNELTGGRRVTKANQAGFYSVFALTPGTYRILVRTPGFEAIIRDGLKLEVGENARLDFTLRIGDSRTTVTVEGGPPLINSQDASVGTVIDRHIIDRMPLNGRGIQALIQLSPGVVGVPVFNASRGQYAVNGQRTDANNFTVDGVSANFAAGNALALQGTSVYAVPLMGQAGMLPAVNFLGTFSNLVSPEALQEFKIQTSTFAPEFGRSPGAQVGLISRSGGNRYSGTLFEHFRNDRLDAADWFHNQRREPKTPLRLNYFGGVLGGPVGIPGRYNGRDRTFFFVSVDSLRAAQPQPVTSWLAPALETRRNAPVLVAPMLNLYPLPNRFSLASGDPAVTGLGEFMRRASLRQDQNTYGLRLDHSFHGRLSAFARYNKSAAHRREPVEIVDLATQHTTETLTVGITHTLSPYTVNEVRANASGQAITVRADVAETEGASRPPDSLLFPAGYSARDSTLFMLIPRAPPAMTGFVSLDRAWQAQYVDNLSHRRGSHQFRVGVDYRWLSPVQIQPRASVLRSLNELRPDGVYDAAAAGMLFADEYEVAWAVKTFSAYAQDTWTPLRRLTMTYGLRWDVNPSPRAITGKGRVLIGVSDLRDLSTGRIAESGAPLYATGWKNIAPRFGLGWQVVDLPGRMTVLRAGAGRFFDLAQSGFQYFSSPQGSRWWDAAHRGLIGSGTAVFDVAPAERPNIVGVAPNYQVPEVYQWNLALEQSIGQQTFSAGYIGALGRGLIGSVRLAAAPPYTEIDFFGNSGQSSYHALQLQLNRRLVGRMRLLFSYAWSHSIDNISNDFAGSVITVRSVDQYLNSSIDRGSSAFDVRHMLNGAVVADLPGRGTGWRGCLSRNWSLSSILFARSALPTHLLGSDLITRPDVIPGQPLYVYSGAYPGGKRYNDAAFANSRRGVAGNLGRNVLRGFGAWQVDLALSRAVRVSQELALQFRVEAFNLLNHPNFANPGDLADPYVLKLRHEPEFGVSTMMLSKGLAPSGVPGQLNPLFQLGGSRSLQLSMRLGF